MTCIGQTVSLYGLTMARNSRSVTATQSRFLAMSTFHMNRPQSIAAAIAAITPSSMNVTFDIGRLKTVPRQAH